MNSPQSTLTFAAPTGQDTFEIQTYDETNGKGNVLSSAFVTQTVSGGSANVVTAILNGVINSLALSVSPLQPTAGTASTMTVSATGYDADGNVIVGPGAYATPIVLSIVDPAKSGTLALSSAVLQQPGATSTLSYNGRTLWSATVSASLSGVTPATVTVAPVPSVTLYPLPNANSFPRGLTVDASNNLWFTEASGNRIGELPNGSTTFVEQPIPTASAGPNGIAVGNDGRIWFTEESASKIGAMTTSGSFTEFATKTSGDFPVYITERGNGTMWYTGFSGGDLGYQNESGGSPGSLPLPTANSVPVGIAVGPNAQLYFTESGANKVGSLYLGSVSPLETSILLPSDGGVLPDPYSIVEGPDGNMWVADLGTAAIGRFSTGNSSFVEYPTPTVGASAYFITAGTDGALWFSESFNGQIGRITTSGTITEYPICSGPQGIAVRSNGVVWVACSSGNALARLIY
jgi:virginiamycin B lyase